MFCRVWELADKGIETTTYTHAECYIWRSIDDDDTRFLVRRALERAKQDAALAEQIRIVVDRWKDMRVVAILGPRIMQSAAQYRDNGFDLGFMGGPAVPPRPRGASRARRGGQTGPSGPGGPSSADANHATSPVGATYGY